MGLTFQKGPQLQLVQPHVPEFVVEEARVLIACNRAAPTELTPTQALEAANVIYHRH